jgi:hypothetical protein
VTVVNVSAGTVTFAASGTSHVSGGVSVALGAATSATPGRRFQWIAAQSLWFAC